MSSSLPVVIAIVRVALGWSVLPGGRVPANCRGRSCQGRSWRQRFPPASKHGLRAFTLARDVERRDATDLASVWHEQLTLGGLYSQVDRSGRAA